MALVEQIPSLVLFTMMLSMGMGLALEDFVRVVSRPRAALLGVFGQLVLLPAAAVAIALALGLPDLVAIGLLLIAACPGGTVSNAFSYLARGDVALSISLTAVSSLVAFVWIPGVFRVGLPLLGLDPAAIELPFLATTGRLFVTVCLPVFLGMGVRRSRPELAVRWQAPILNGSIAVMMLLVAALPFQLLAEGVDLWTLAARGTPAVLLLLGITIGTTALLGRMLGIRGERARTLWIEVGIQNFALAMVIALSLLKKPEVLGTALIYLPAMLGAATLVVLSGRLQQGAPVARATE